MNQNRDKRSYKNCCSAGCINTTYNSELTFFSLPPDPDRRRVWLKLLLREDLEDKNAMHYRVCENHFDSDSILVTPTRKLLKKLALPCRLLPMPDDGSSEPNMLCANCKAVPILVPQTTSELNTRKRKLRPDSYMPHPKKIDIFFELCDTLLTKKLAKIVKEQAQIYLNDFRNSNDIGYKVFCLNLYYVSPEAYSLLSDTLCLPPRASLVRMCEPVFTQPNHIMKVLKLKADRMTEREKHCCVFIDAIKLKKNFYYFLKEDKIFGFHHEVGVRPSGPAKYGLVAVVQGIFGDYRQPAGYIMLAPDADSARVAQWTDHLIRQLFEGGLNVRALIPGSTYPFLNSAKTRKVSVSTPYFFVDGKKIYYMFDPAQIFVDTRDSLMMYDFHYHSFVAKWDDFRQFFEKDSAMVLRLAPKLRERHVEPSGAEQWQQARLAVQVFSAPVAAGMTAYASLGGLDPSVEGTIDLFAKINDLVEFFNLSSKYDCPSHRNDFSDQVHKVYFINSMLIFFSNLKVIDEKNGIDVTSLVSFIDAFQITLKCILHLYEEFDMNGFTYELTKQLSRDYIDKLIDGVTKTHASTEPTSWLLVSEFRKSYLEVLFRPRKQSEDTNNHMSELYGASEATTLKKSAPKGVPKAPAKKRKQTSKQQNSGVVGTVKDSIPHTINQEPEMEEDEDIIAQIKREQEEFLSMDIEIEEHEITSRQQKQNNELSHIKSDNDSFPVEEDKDGAMNTSQQIKQEEEGFLSASFEVNYDELILVISSREQEHNYDSTIIKQEPEINTGENISSIQDDIAKGSTSKDESTNSPHASKPDQQDLSSDDSESEEGIAGECLPKPSMLESDDILTLIFNIDDKNTREPYKKCREPIRTTDYILNFPKNNGLVFISSWLLQKCLFWHKNCDDFHAYIVFDSERNPNHLDQPQYSRYKDYCTNDAADLPIIPQNGFIQYVETMDQIFSDFFKCPPIHTRNILGGMLEVAIEVSYVNLLPCDCFPLDYARQLFFRIRLHYTLEYNNRCKAKRFVVPKL